MIAPLIAALLAAASPPVPPIDVPSQAMPAFAAYTRCVQDRFRVNMLLVHDMDEAEAGWREAVGFCRDVRARLLAVALKRTTDRRIFGSRAKAREVARRAFDRFDNEFRLEWEPAPPGARVQGSVE